VVQSGHPSPLSARHFLGTKPFSQIDKALADFGQTPVNWQLSD
jgi:uracil-DNA glycosylase